MWDNSSSCSFLSEKLIHTMFSRALYLRNAWMNPYESISFIHCLQRSFSHRGFSGFSISRKRSFQHALERWWEIGNVFHVTHQCWIKGHYPQTHQTSIIPLLPGLVLVEWRCHEFRKNRALAVQNWPQDSTVSVQCPSTLSFPTYFYLVHASSLLLCSLPNQTTRDGYWIPRWVPCWYYS